MNNSFSRDLSIESFLCHAVFFASLWLCSTLAFRKLYVWYCFLCNVKTDQKNTGLRFLLESPQYSYYEEVLCMRSACL